MTQTVIKKLILNIIFLDHDMDWLFNVSELQSHWILEGVGTLGSVQLLEIMTVQATLICSNAFIIL